MSTKTELQRYESLKATIRANIPGFEVRYKNESRLMALINIALRWFNPDFMTLYNTTLGDKMYFPTRAYEQEDIARAFDIMAHEYVHMLDRKREGVGFFFGYAWPQVFALLALLAGLAPLWSGALFCLAFLLFLLPLPAPARAAAELRAYTMTLAVIYWRNGTLYPSDYEWITNALCGGGYYWAGWNKTSVTAELETIRLRILTGAVDFDSVAFVQVKSLLKDA